MKSAYPIVMTQGEEFIMVFIPDFNINTQGKNIPDAIEMARDAIGIMGIDMQDDGEALPEASNLANVQAGSPSGSIVSLVRQFGARAIKREGLSLPALLLSLQIV